MPPGATAVVRIERERSAAGSIGVEEPDSGRNWTRRRAARSAYSEYSLKGSRFSWMVPEKRTASLVDEGQLGEKLDRL